MAVEVRRVRKITSSYVTPIETQAQMDAIADNSYVLLASKENVLSDTPTESGTNYKVALSLLMSKLAENGQYAYDLLTYFTSYSLGRGSEGDYINIDYSTYHNQYDPNLVYQVFSASPNLAYMQGDGTIGFGLVNHEMLMSYVREFFGTYFNADGGEIDKIEEIIEWFRGAQDTSYWDLVQNIVINSNNIAELINNFELYKDEITSLLQQYVNGEIAPIYIDTELDGNSHNPVENRAVYEAIMNITDGGGAGGGAVGIDEEHNSFKVGSTTYRLVLNSESKLAFTTAVDFSLSVSPSSNVSPTRYEIDATPTSAVTLSYSATASGEGANTVEGYWTSPKYIGYQSDGTTLTQVSGLANHSVSYKPTNNNNATISDSFTLHWRKGSSGSYSTKSTGTYTFQFDLFTIGFYKSNGNVTWQSGWSKNNSSGYSVTTPSGITEAAKKTGMSSVTCNVNFATNNGDYLYIAVPTSAASGVKIYLTTNSTKPNDPAGFNKTEKATFKTYSTNKEYTVFRSSNATGSGRVYIWLDA